ncbi:MAG: hypothetical protein JXA89_28760 [Anaerolineae bacterium]|nr:hypothetical protein [Anaerolineae bacterium]
MGLLARIYGPEQEKALAACRQQKLIDDLRREIIAEQRRQGQAARRDSRILGCFTRGKLRQTHS